MADYKCSKCGETASSKCVGQRSVFPSNMYATMVGNLIRIKAVRKGSEDERYRREVDSDRWTVTYTVTADYIPAQDETEAIAQAGIPALLLDLPKDTLRIAFCDHYWVMESAKCDLGCCKKTVDCAA